MRFLRPSRLLKAKTTPQRATDLALLLTALPLLPFLKPPMLLFLALALFAAIKKRQTSLTTALITAVGIGAVALSLMDTLSFSSLSRITLFVIAVAHLLVLAVTLQRLRAEYNLYLYLSPALFLILTLFLYRGIGMLIYLLLLLSLLLWLTVAATMKASLREAFKPAAALWLASLPFAAALFLFFPRVALTDASFGFRADTNARIGHDGKMYLDQRAADVLSERTVMEIAFEDPPPAPSALYFRGSVLYVDRVTYWAPLTFTDTRPPQIDRADRLVRYRVALRPTAKRWLYTLDLPLEVPKPARLDRSAQARLAHPLTDPIRYEATSALTYRYGQNTPKALLEAALRADPSANPKTARLARQLRRDFPDPVKRATALMKRFKAADLTYTLHPPPLDLKHLCDDFLFRVKRGYCVHFSAALATFARLAGLPARVVTGYKGRAENLAGRYLLIQERDAHAWVEIYVKKSWRRIEATALASAVADDPQTQALLSHADPSSATDNASILRWPLYWRYLKFQIDRWILNYNRLRQIQLMERLKEPFSQTARPPIWIWPTVLFAALWYLLKRRSKYPESVRIVKKVIKKATKQGCMPKAEESAEETIRRCARSGESKRAAEALIDAFYAARYGDGNISTLRQAAEAYLRSLKG